jgi:hypothetical protein
MRSGLSARPGDKPKQLGLISYLLLWGVKRHQRTGDYRFVTFSCAKFNLSGTFCPVA